MMMERVMIVLMYIYIYIWVVSEVKWYFRNVSSEEEVESSYLKFFRVG